jgi:glycosyltransferase involved in cell wall biosynthesis
MRILAINWQDRKHPYAGGAEVHLHEIFSRLGARGHHVTLLCCGFDGAPVEESYDNMRIVRRGGRLLFNFGVNRWARELLSQGAFDVVIDDINKIPFYTARFIERPILGIVHHLFGKAIYQEVDPLSASYVYLAESLVPRYYRAVPIMVVSESTRDDLIARGMNRELIRVVHNGIDLTHYSPGSSEAKAATPTVCFLGRVKRYKSIDHMLHAVKNLCDEIPTIKAHIVGSGGDESRLRKLAAELGISGRVTFHGFMPLAEKVEIVRQSWVVICPSIKEGWGLTNIEANACGTPVICADVPGLRDSARNEQTGLLYPYGDITALTDRMRRMLHDSDLRQRLVKGAIEWAGRFSWERAADETEAILNQIIAGDRKIGHGH